jgi:two-component system, NarL family, nitrate/nitrite response regulator NarL
MMQVVLNSPISVAIVDNNPILTDALCQRLSRASEVQASAGEADARRGITLASGDCPDVILIDPLAFGRDPEAIRMMAPNSALIAYLPGAQSEAERLCAHACVIAGFRGLMTKTVPYDVVLSAIQMIARGGIYVEGTFSESVFQASIAGRRGNPSRAQLTEREAFVLKSVARGMSMKEIGGLLDLSAKTIETYKARASSKLNLQSRREIVDYAIRSGWVQSVA